MKTISVGGIPMSEIALGAGKRGPREADKACFAVMDHYVERGGRCLDSARMYADGQSDEALGRWLKSRGLRDQVTLVLKGCYPATRLSPADISGDLEASLRAIGTDHADLYLLHRDNPNLPVSEIMPTLHRMVLEGKTRAIGCSNWTIGRIIEANEFARMNGMTEFVTCQIHFSLAQTTAAQTRDLTHVPMSDVEFTWYEESQMPIMAFSPQARGYFYRKQQGLPMREGDTRYYDYIPENRRRAERLERLSKASDRSISSILIAYARDNRLNAVPLSAFSSIAQLDDALGAQEFTLTPEEIRYLETGEGLFA